MERLIDADAFDKRIRLDVGSCEEELTEDFKDGISTILEMMKTAPTVDAVPVRHGRWIKKRYWSEGVGMGERYGYYYSCSKCGNLVCGGYDECGKKYCDECGARMDGKGNGNETD